MNWGQKGHEPMLMECGSFVPPKNMKKKKLLDHEVEIKLRSLKRQLRRQKQKRFLSKPRMLESLAGCRTMFLFAVSCKIGPLERNTY